MKLIGIDLGGTKIASAIFNENGAIESRNVIKLGERRGRDVGQLIMQMIETFIRQAEKNGENIASIGISVPGIYNAEHGRVWAPNIPEWDDYPLPDEVRSLPSVANKIVSIDSDRACYILGETWQGKTIGCRNAIFVAFGTGIGAGILVDDTILRGQDDIAGAIGWMGMNAPYDDKYKPCGHFEYYASGDGIARTAREYLDKNQHTPSKLRGIIPNQLTAHHVFDAFCEGDLAAKEVLDYCIELWGMAIANLVSIFNPQKVILGGGVFGPAAQFLDQIKLEAKKWAQPISFAKVDVDVSALGSDAGLIGAGYLALRALLNRETKMQER